MAPSGGPTNGDEHTGQPAASGTVTSPTTQPAASKSPKAQPNGDTTANQKKSAPSNDGKLSGKDAKLKAKAEKAARRAQEKVGLQVPLQTDPASKSADASQKTPKSPNAGPHTSKPHHKRNMSGPKALPVRSAEGQDTHAIAQPKKEDKRVPLLEHLYSSPRRTSLAGAGKDVHPAVLALGLQMSSYVVCGSTARCVAMLLAFKEVIASYITPPQTSLTRHLTTHISAQIEYLISCRPLSVSMGNAIRWLKLVISEVDISTPEPEAKADLCSTIDAFVREKTVVADRIISEKVVETIKSGDVIVTFGKSHIVQKSLVAAAMQGKSFKVVTVDSRPLHEGRNLAQTLSNVGIEVECCLINAIGHTLKSATKVILGAHAMMSNGSLYSRVGTAMLAVAAKQQNTPVMVCCESLKFTDRVAVDAFVHNEIASPDELLVESQAKVSGMDDWNEVPNLQLLNLMYDVTPTECIDVVVTEYGSLPPSAVQAIHRLSTNT